MRRAPEIPRRRPRTTPDSRSCWALVFCSLVASCSGATDTGEAGADPADLRGLWINVVDDPRFDVYQDYGQGPIVNLGLVVGDSRATSALYLERATIALEMGNPDAVDSASVGSVTQQCIFPWAPDDRASTSPRLDRFFGTFPFGDGSSELRPLWLAYRSEFVDGELWEDEYGDLACHLESQDLLVCRWYLPSWADPAAELRSRRMAFRKAAGGLEQLNRQRCDTLLSDYLVGGARP